MNRPKLVLEEVMELIKTAPASLEESMAAYVKANRLSQAEAEQYVKQYSKAYHEPIKVIAIRGYYKNSMGEPDKNDRGIYDDAMVVIGPNYYQTFNANTDPSRYQKGIGMILPGWHLYKPGKHGISGPRPYAAFRPATADESVPGLRDGQFGIKKIITPNIHSGGEQNVNSAACQTVKKSQWLEFQPTIYKMLAMEGQKYLPYLLRENL